MKLIEIFEIVFDVKLIEEAESYSFFRLINEKIYRFNYRQKPALWKVTTITYHRTHVQNRIIFHRTIQKYTLSNVNDLISRWYKQVVIKLQSRR